jgi:hypothetical protein
VGKAAMMRLATTDERNSAMHAFILKCIQPDRQARFIEFLATEKGLRKFVSQLDHFQNYINQSGAVSCQHCRDGQAVCNDFHLELNSDVFVLSTLRGMTTGVVMQLGAAVESTFKIGNGSLVCSTGSINPVYMYFGEEPSEQYLWQCRTRAL